MNVLVIEEEREIAVSIKCGLEENHYQVTTAYDGVEGLEQAMTGEYDLVILGVMLPKKDGFVVIKELRAAENQVPVLMLTARGTTEDIVYGLEAGCDDYLSKPFAFVELLARVKALLRRSKRKRGAEIVFADLRLDPLARKVWRNSNEIDLSTREYELLKYMMCNPNKPLSSATLANNCCGRDSYNFSIAVYITYLRKKVDKDYSTKLIRTIRGQGYMLKHAEFEQQETK